MSSELTREQILEALRAPFPPELIKQKDGGRGMKLSYVSGVDVLERLDQSTNGWSEEVTWREFKKIQMTRWNDSKQTREPYELEVLMVEVRLTIPELGTRTGAGVQELQANAGADVMKGAWTDAVKVAASKFGVARHLYWGDDGMSDFQGHSAPQARDAGQYSNRGNNAPQRPAQPQQGGQSRSGGFHDASQQRHQGNRPAPGPGAISPAQINFIRRLASDREMGEQQIHDYVMNISGGVPLDDLSKQQASTVIEQLKDIPVISPEGPN